MSKQKRWRKGKRTAFAPCQREGCFGMGKMSIWRDFKPHDMGNTASGGMFSCLFHYTMVLAYAFVNFLSRKFAVKRQDDFAYLTNISGIFFC